VRRSALPLRQGGHRESVVDRWCARMRRDRQFAPVARRPSLEAPGHSSDRRYGITFSWRRARGGPPALSPGEAPTRSTRRQEGGPGGYPLRRAAVQRARGGEIWCSLPCVVCFSAIVTRGSNTYGCIIPKDHPALITNALGPAAAHLRDVERGDNLRRGPCRGIDLPCAKGVPARLQHRGRQRDHRLTRANAVLRSAREAFRAEAVVTDRPRP